MVLCVLGAQSEGVGAKIAYCRQESGVADLLHPGAVLAKVDGASVDRVPTGEVRVRAFACTPTTVPACLADLKAGHCAVAPKKPMLCKCKRK